MQSSKFASIFCLFITVGLKNVQTVASYEGSWPWMALLGSYNNNTTETDYFCGGALISQRHIVTAAHCFFFDVKLNAFARLGVTDFDDYSDDGLNIPIERVYIHPKYSYQPTIQNDVAVLKLESDVQFTDSIHPICMPMPKNIRNKNFDGESVFIAGWGSVKHGLDMNDQLLETKLQVVSLNECQEAFWNTDNVDPNSDMICAGNEYKSTCEGDSGGPLMYADGSTYYLIGIVSNGVDCGIQGTPSAFMRVSSYLDFILASMN